MAILTLLGAALRLVLLGQIPPGFHYDEAVYGLQALDIYRGQWPVYFSSYTGREPLYMYLIAIVFRIVGIGELGVRLTSALAGIATIPLVFLLVQEITNRRIGLLAAALTAFSFWHLVVSRNGYPNVLIPPIECLGLFFLWRGYRDGRLIQSAVGGALLGLVLYTYLAARFFPITVAFFFFYCLVVDWPRFRQRFWGLALAVVVTIAVFAPLGLYFLRHPQDFVERANQVLVFQQAGPLPAMGMVLRNLGQSMAGLFVHGDPRNHFNLSGKPMLTPIGGVLFLIGLIVTFRRWRQPQYALLPIWMLGMTLPAILTVAEMPQGQRMFGIIPALYGLVALGLDSLLTFLQQRLTTLRPNMRWLGPTLLVGVLAFEGISTTHTYFGVWARRAETFYSFHGDYMLMAERALAELDARNVPVIVSREYKHPGMVLGDSRILDAIWVSGGRNLVIPHQPEQALRYLWPAQSLEIDGAIDDLMATLTEPVDELLDPNGQPAVHVSRLKSGVQAREQSLTAIANFAGEIEVLDWQLPNRARRDKPLRMLVHWRVRQVGQGHVLALHLVDEYGVRWSQSRDMGYFSENWRPGDSIYQSFALDLPPGIPAGQYEALLLLAREDDRLLPVIQDGEMVGVSLSLGQVTLKPDGATISPVASPVMALAPELQAVAWTERETTAVLGGELQVPVTWQATDEISTDHQIVLELLDAQGAVALAQTMALGYQYPTSDWQIGEIVQAIYLMSLHDVEAGDYRLQLRLSDLPSAPLLPLGTVHIGGEARVFEIPPMQHVVSATLAQEIELLGYDLVRDRYVSGEEMNITLYWRALVEPSGDDKVFVHLVAPDGTLASQSDAVPANWSRPTMGWALQEIVADEHTLAIPKGAAPGSYALYAGMYDAATLQRLPLMQEGQAQADGRLLLGTVTIDQ